MKVIIQVSKEDYDKIKSSLKEGETAEEIIREKVIDSLEYILEAEVEVLLPLGSEVKKILSNLI